jgi:hypothetical protein
MPQIDSGPERGGTSREGLGPSSEAGTRPRGRQALEQGENLPERVPSHRARRWFRGAVLAPRAGRRFARGVPRTAVCWAAEAFWAVGLSLPWAAATRGVICSL